MRDKRNAKLWLQYLEMVEILLSFIKSDRTGNRHLHLKMAQAMLPFLAASAHNNTQNPCVPVSTEHADPQEIHPEVYMHFEEGYHVIRRSNMYWAGLPADRLLTVFL